MKILAIRNDRLGEFLLTIPALKALKADNPENYLTIAVSEGIKELAVSAGLADEIITWDSRRKDIKGAFLRGREIAKLKYDLAVVFNPSKQSHISVFSAGIPLRAGYDRKWPFLLNRKIPDEKELGLFHEAEYNLMLSRMALGKDLEMPPLSIKVIPDSLSSLEGMNGPAFQENVICVHPFTSDPVKDWGWSKFSLLIRRLSEAVNVKIIVIGYPAVPAVSAALKTMGPRVIDFTGKTSLVQLAALLARSSLLISCDSGPVHLACCTGTPVIALFRNDLAGKTPKRWGPWGPGNIVIEKNDLDSITVEDVMTKVKGRSN